MSVAFLADYEKLFRFKLTGNTFQIKAKGQKVKILKKKYITF